MTVAAAATRALGERVTVEERVQGGDIGQAFRARGADGRPLFVKTAPAPPTGFFVAEAAGLRALASASGGCRVPEVLGVSEECLVLEWIERGGGGRRPSEALARGLAALHRVERATCGFDAGDGFIGRTPQPNPDIDDLAVFFRDHRLGHQQRLLRRSGRCPASLDRAIDRLLDAVTRRLSIPSERPALLHGDLWSGNWMPGPSGEAVLFDPAAYFGCREADLAMTELFGGFDADFYSAYMEAFPLEPGYAERRDIYNIYHLLNHANLFGGGWANRAEHAIAAIL